MNEREMFMNYLQAMMEREERQTPVKHHGFGLPKHFRVVEVDAKAQVERTVTASEYREVAVSMAEEQSAQTGQRFECRAMWL